MTRSISDTLASVNSISRIPRISALLFNAQMATADDTRRARLRELIDQFKTIEALAEATGTSAAYLSQISNGIRDSKTGKPRNMGTALARKIELALKKTVGWMDSLDEHANARPIAARGLVPVMGEARLGDRGFYEESNFTASDGFVKYPMNDPNAYALRCKGDSMFPRIKNGQYVVVEPHHPIGIGDEVAVRTVDGRHMIKTYSLKRNGEYSFGSINEDTPTITVPEHEVVTMHYVAGILNPGSYYPD